MIAYPRSEEGYAATIKARVIGLGNAGVHLVDRLTMAGHSSIDIVALNTDSQSLASSVAPQKIALGQRITRGLGTGGDPELGYEAAQESLDEIRALVEGAELIFLCAGLGGGTASGIAPMVAEAAREGGATVFAVVTSPFSFEGKRRTAQAAEALAGLATHSHAVIHFENDRMAEIASPRSGIEETFTSSDEILIECMTSLLAVLQGGSPMPVSLSDLLAAVRGGSATTLFGRGTAAGDNRAHEALERALKSPLLDRGRMLTESHAVVAHVSGPPSLSFAEVAAIMRELGRYIADHTQLFLGVTTEIDTSAPLAVTILGNFSGEAVTLPERVHRDVPISESRPRSNPIPQTVVEAIDESPVETDEPPPLFPDPEPVAATLPSAPAPVAEEKPAAPKPAPRETRPVATKSSVPAQPPTPPKVKQETLQFESVVRGRFEKSEPTIVEGEDLDVPTFLRMRGKTK